MGFMSQEQSANAERVVLDKLKFLTQIVILVIGQCSHVRSANAVWVLLPIFCQRQFQWPLLSQQTFNLVLESQKF
jgi:hypothetical protein